MLGRSSGATSEVPAGTSGVYLYVGGCCHRVALQERLGEGGAPAEARSPDRPLPVP